MRFIFLLLVLVLVPGCSSQGEGKSLLETLEFGEDETGCFRLNGVIDTGGNPFASANVTVNLVKRKGDGPDC